MSFQVWQTECQAAEYRKRIDFYRSKMQEIIMFKSRCDNKLNDVSEQVAAAKRQASARGGRGRWNRACERGREGEEREKGKLCVYTRAGGEGRERERKGGVREGGREKERERE